MPGIYIEIWVAAQESSIRPQLQMLSLQDTILPMGLTFLKRLLKRMIEGEDPVGCDVEVGERMEPSPRSALDSP